MNLYPTNFFNMSCFDIEDPYLVKDQSEYGFFYLLKGFPLWDLIVLTKSESDNANTALDM